MWVYEHTRRHFVYPTPNPNTNPNPNPNPNLNSNPGHISLLGAIETHRNRAVYVSLNTNAHPTPNPNTNPNPNPDPNPNLTSLSVMQSYGAQ